jgi:hypothetical protein
MHAHQTHLVLAALALATAPGMAAARGETHGQVAFEKAAATCAGVPDGRSWAFAVGSVQSVDPMFQNTRSGRRLSGATLTLRAEHDLSAADAERAIRCQIARNALGSTRDGGPLAIEGARARVVESGSGRYLLQLWSDYVGAGPEILARSRALERPSI